MDNTVQDASHLKNDSGGLIAELDVKEYLETRERNAREDRAFAYKSRVLDRAREVTNRSYEHEVKILRKGLHDLTAKTPNFWSATLAKSAAGPYASNTSMRLLKTKQPNRPHLQKSTREPKKLRSKSLPALSQRSVDIRVAVSPENTFSRNSEPVIPPIGRYPSTETSGCAQMMDSATESSIGYDKGSLNLHAMRDDKLLDRGRLLGGRSAYDQLRLDAEIARNQAAKRRNLPPLKQNPDLWRSSTKNFMKRSKYVQSTLSSLYKKRSKAIKMMNQPQRPNYVIEKEQPGQHPITVHSAINLESSSSSTDNVVDWRRESAALRT